MGCGDQGCMVGALGHANRLFDTNGVGMWMNLWLSSVGHQVCSSEVFCGLSFAMAY